MHTLTTPLIITVITKTHVSKQDKVLQPSLLEQYYTIVKPQTNIEMLLNDQSKKIPREQVLVLE